jgi:phage terminase small subunit
VEYGLRLDAQALDLAKELGMTPASRAKLGLDLARTSRTLEEQVADANDAWEESAIEGGLTDERVQP